MKVLALVGGFLYFVRLLLHWILQLYCFCFHEHPTMENGQVRHRLGLLGITVEIEK
jgi:hypothetical protein